MERRTALCLAASAIIRLVCPVDDAARAEDAGELPRKGAVAVRMPEELAKALADFVALVRKGDCLGARDFAARAAASGETARFARELRAASEVARLLAERHRAVRRAAEVMIDKDVAIRTVKGVRKGKVSSVEERGLGLTVKVVVNRRVVGESTYVVAWSDLAPEETKKLAAGWDPKGEAGAAAKSLAAYLQGNTKTAESALASAAEHPIARYVRGRIAASRPRAAEAAGEAGKAEAPPRKPRHEAARWPPDIGEMRRLFRSEVVSWSPEALELELRCDFDDRRQMEDWFLTAWAFGKTRGTSFTMRGGALRLPPMGNYVTLKGSFRKVAASVDYLYVRGKGSIGLLVCASDDGDFYRVTPIMRGKDAYICKRVKGVHSYLSGVSRSPYAGARSGRVSAEFADGRIRGVVGQLVFEAEDASFATGQVGLWAPDTEAAFDRLQVKGTLDRAWLEKALRDLGGK